MTSDSQTLSQDTALSVPVTTGRFGYNPVNQTINALPILFGLMRQEL